MVLESLFPEKQIENKPIDMLLISFLVSLVSIFVSYAVFPAYAGIITPLLVAVAVAPLIQRLFEEEEREMKEEEKEGIYGFWQRHSEVIKIFSMFFIGNFLSIFLIMALMPESFVTQVFEPQINDIAAVRSVGATGQAIAETNILNIILLNNLKVMAFAFLLSFLFGTGATFILSWNASILAIFLAGFFREGQILALLSTTTGIIPHAVIEILAYFVAGIAGGILSVGIVREKFLSHEFKLILKDAIYMMAVAVIFVAIGGYVEVTL